jgi:hypothetical protein
LAFDVFLTEEARGFLESLSADYRALCEELLLRLAEEPFNEFTVARPRPEATDALASNIGPFVILPPCQ